jgi:methylated-DNA-[protein]-cysteine S-methyltransferase
VTRYCWVDWPLGRLLLTADADALTGVHFEGGRDAIAPAPDWRLDDEALPLRRAREQLAEYCGGQRQAFDLPLRPKGTEFQQRVWAAIARVPFGQRITYRELAVRAGSPEGSRAAGLATGRNPIALVIPCHRIVGSNGSLTGFGGGLATKKSLLEFEAAVSRGVPARLR